MNKKPSLVLFAVFAITATLALGACGGGTGGSDSSSTEPTGAPRPSGGSDTGGGGDTGGDSKPQSTDQGDGGHGEGKGRGAQEGSTGGGEGRRRVPVAPLEVSGGGSAQFHVKGGDNSVQDYGEEAEGGELRQAAEATHSLFVANVRGEWARACSLLAAEVRENLEKAAAQSPRPGAQGCAAALDAVTQPVSGSLAREITRVDAVSLRHEGEQAFLIYVGAPGGTVYAMPLRFEAGIWKPAAISGAALPGVRTN